MSDPPKHRILVVDDDAAIRDSFARLVQSFGHEVETASDGIEALGKLPLDIDFVLLDAEMPGLDGFEVAQRIRGMTEYAHLPIVMVTGLTRPEDRRRALEVGINDFINKPVERDELWLRMKWLLELKTTHDRLRAHEAELELVIERKTRALRAALDEMIQARRLVHEAQMDTIRRLTIAAEFKDPDTAGHIERIGLYSEVMARKLGLSPGEVETLRHAATMHDVGKIATPDRVLLKPGKLDDDEWVVMQSHASVGGDMLAGSMSPELQMGEMIARTHHEKWDGSGYPAALAGDAIPVESRICAIVDFYDALTMDRPYRAAVPFDEVLEIMRGMGGTHFDPDLLDTFFEVFDDIRKVQTTHS